MNANASNAQVPAHHEPVPQPKPLHAEAFCLMRYQNLRTGEVEVLWNSRDGVTPFCIPSRDGKDEMRHIDFKRDRFAPDHKPTPGQRVFVSITRERATEIAKARVELYWDNGECPMNKTFETKEAAVEALTRDFYGSGGEPDLATPVPLPTFGRAAFDAYRAHAGGKNHDGSPTPEWPALTDAVRSHWDAAADALLADKQGTIEGLERKLRQVEGDFRDLVQAIHAGKLSTTTLVLQGLLANPEANIDPAPSERKKACATAVAWAKDLIQAVVDDKPAS